MTRRENEKNPQQKAADATTATHTAPGRKGILRVVYAGYKRWYTDQDSCKRNHIPAVRDKQSCFISRQTVTGKVMVLTLNTAAGYGLEI